MTFESDKKVITIQDILEMYYYLEWIKDDASELGLTISKSKADLIDDLLDEYQRRRVDAWEIVVHLISTLRVVELRQIAYDNNLGTSGKKDELVDRILNSLQFEPVIKLVDRVCPVCKVDSTQEMHFGNDWKATHYLCENCGHEIKMSNNKDSNSRAEVSVEEETQETNKDSTDGGLVRIAIDVGTIVSGTIAISVASFSTTLPKFGIFFSLGIGLLSVIICTISLTFTRKMWSDKLYSFIVRSDENHRQHEI